MWWWKKRNAKSSSISERIPLLNSALETGICDDVIAEITLHMARTEAKSLPLEARLSSKEWLQLRGHPSCDDGDL